MIYLYTSSVPEFVKFASDGEISTILKQEFPKKFDKHPGEQEVTSWTNSLKALAGILEDSAFSETHIFLEFQMPLCSTRCDVILVGKDLQGNSNAIVLELKQWQYVTYSNKDRVLLKGKGHLHPSAQVKGYCKYLEYYHEAFTEQAVRISGCSFLHNLENSEVIAMLNNPAYFDVLPRDYQVFSKKNQSQLKEYIVKKVGHGGGNDVAKKLISGTIKPSTKLLNVVSQAINDTFEWRLLDEQKLVFSTIVSKVEEARNSSTKKYVLIVRGGPGTGKSVLAIQLLGYAAKEHWRIAHSTGSQAFKIVLHATTEKSADDLLKKSYGVRYKKDIPIKELFTTFSDIARLGARSKNALDLVVADEAHRLWDFRRQKIGNFDKQVSDTPMVEELVAASKVTAFFLDDMQSVRANEIGSVEFIKNKVENMGIPVEVIDLNTQFRCAGSQSYMDWVDHSLEFTDENSLAWKRFGGYDFQIMASMQEMKEKLDVWQDERNTCRFVAGFCWRWSDPLANGSLVHDVKDSRFNGWSAAWIEKADQNAPPLNHRYFKWATNETYYSQVGSIYSIQGFEFDYIGLIFGEDLVWRSGSWKQQIDKNKDNKFKRDIRSIQEDPLEKLKNIYRVLLTRGMKGTYVFFLDEETRNHFQEMLQEKQKIVSLT